MGNYILWVSLMNRSIYDENIIDKLLNAKDLFEVELDFMKPKVVYPETPDLQFKNDDEKKIFGEIHKWLFEIETELEEKNRAIKTLKKFSKTSFQKLMMTMRRRMRIVTR